MGRPHGDKYFDVDGFLVNRVFDETANSFEAPTTVIRRVVRGCWNGDPDYVAVIANFLPTPSQAELYASLDGKPMPVDGGVLTSTVSRGSDGLRGTWVFTPTLAVVRRVLGASEEAVVKRLLKRLGPDTLRFRGKAVARMSPRFSSPFVKLDSRRGRRRKPRV